MLRRLPPEPEPGHDRKVRGASEVRVVAAEREHELAAIEPHEEREASCQLAVPAEDPGVIRELGLDGKDPLDRAEARLERKLHRDERVVGGGKQHPADAEDSDLEAAIERHVHERARVDETERREAHARGQPESAAASGNQRAHGPEGRHRIGGKRAGVERVDQRMRGHLVNRGRQNERAVVAKARRQPRDEEEGRPAQRGGDGDECEEGRVGAFGIARPTVRADGCHGAPGALKEQEAGVLDGRPRILA